MILPCFALSVLPCRLDHCRQMNWWRVRRDLTSGAAAIAMLHLGRGQVQVFRRLVIKPVVIAVLKLGWLYVAQYHGRFPEVLQDHR